MRNLLILFAALLPLASLAATAQETPPIPRPRPDRGEASFLRPQDTQNQSDALKALSSALQEHTGDHPLPQPGLPQPMTLSAKISEDGAIIPQGLVWRVFDPKTDANGQLPLLAKSEDAVAVFDLTPGDYVVHVAYGRSQATDTLHVEQGITSKTFILDSGALRLNAAISGDLPIASEDLKFEIYATDSSDQERVLVAENIKPGEMVHLNAGIYNVVSQFGGVNAQVRADLRVEPGQITDATLYHRASRVNFKLVSEAGGEAIADVDWTLKSDSGETLFTDFGAFPTAILAEGEYSILARRGDNVYNRDFSVSAGPAQEVEVLTTVY